SPVEGEPIMCLKAGASILRGWARAAAFGLALAATPAFAQGFGTSQGGALGSLLQQLQQLQSTGQLERGGGPVTSPVDTARGERDRRQQQRDALGALGGGIAQERLGIANLNQEETMLVQQFCRGELEPEQIKLVELIRNFSRIERDYCRRAGEVLIQ